jgi:predicted RND superfamily exporter protein
VLFVEQQKGPSLWDGRYLVAWAEDLRKARMSDGTRPPLAGRGPVFADMIRVVWTDGPKAVLASFVATFLLVLFAFRRSLERFMAMFGLLLGILLMAGTMAAAQMKLNFLNFVAFPITFGNGVDYGVNVLRRFSAERDEGAELPLAVRRSIEETGGAVVLCSLTTVIGYSTLYVSANRALKSFGAALAISEITCLVAAVLTVPALMLWRKSR